MTFPANPILEAAPYGPQPVLPVVGPQGGPYVVGGPQPMTLFPAAARAVAVSTPAQTNNGYRGLQLWLNVTANPGGAQTLALTLRAIDPVSLAEIALLTVPASATPGGVYLLYPSLSGAPVEGVSLTRNLILPYFWYVNITPSGVGSWTYSLGGILLP